MGKDLPSKEMASVAEAAKVLPVVSVIRRLDPALEATLQESTVSAAQNVASQGLSVAYTVLPEASSEPARTLCAS